MKWADAEASMMGNVIDIKGQKFNRLTALFYVGNARWMCRCDCGTEKIIQSYELRKLKTISCGCYRNEQVSKARTKHGESFTPLHNVWVGIKTRTKHADNPAYKNYAGRGISLFPEWNDYMKFREWALSNGYVEGLTIERKDVNGNYEPSNCTWIPRGDQNKNKRNSRWITFEGRTMIVSDWERKLGMKPRVISNRLADGWSVDEALTVPVAPNGGRFQNGHPYYE